MFKVSADNGQTFGPLRVAYSESNATSKVTIGNPSPVVVGGKVLLLCIRNHQDLLRLRSADAAGLIWPKPGAAEDITLDTFAASNVNAVMRCGPGALAAGGDMRQANLTAAAAER